MDTAVTVSDEASLRKIDCRTVIEKMAVGLVEHYAHLGIVDSDLRSQVLMVGIHTAGVWVAQRMHTALGMKVPLGVLDINFYRDDFSHVGLNPQVKPSRMPCDIADRHVILVDDVIHTGRTVVAAIKEISDYGRARSITLAVLAYRRGREMPISADVYGIECELLPHQYLKIKNPRDFQLLIVNRKESSPRPQTDRH